MTPAVIVQSPSRSKSEQEAMAQNGGHVYFSVHMDECAACRAEYHRRHKDDGTDMAIGITLGLSILIVVWCAIYEEAAGERAWLWINWYRLRVLRRKDR